MIHFSCDLCGRPLLADEDVRYVVKSQVFAACDPMELTRADLERDDAAEMRKLLDQMAETDARTLEAQVFKQLRFDLCQACRDRYLEDPLMRTVRHRLDVREN